jgi:hypothetical protein
MMCHDTCQYDYLDCPQMKVCYSYRWTALSYSLYLTNLSIYLSIYLYLSVCLSVIHLFIYLLSIYLSIRLLEVFLKY